MGCKQSKIKVQPVGPAKESRDNRNLARGESLIEYEIDDRTGNKKRLNKSKSKKSFGSNVSLDDERSTADSDRGFSATSKTSKNSNDSGLGDDYGHIITEDSNPDAVAQIEGEFGDERDDLDLGIVGTAVVPRASAKDRERLEEAMVMQALREEGLIARQTAQSNGGMSFDIMADGEAIRPPPRLAKLERRKKKKTLTEEDIRKKLEKAERRKKRKEQERLEKIKEKEKSNPNAALDKFAQLQKEKEEQVYQKMDTVTENKEKRLMEIREKIRKREEHAALVRKRKELAKLEAGLNEQENNEQNQISADQSQ